MKIALGLAAAAIALVVQPGAADTAAPTTAPAHPEAREQALDAAE